MPDLPFSTGGAAILCLVGVLAASQGDGSGPAPGGRARQDGCTASGCHAEVSRHRLVHQPVAVGNCQACHTPVARSTPFEQGSRHQFERAWEDARACLGCHDGYGEEAHVHEPVRQGLCVLCHSPHGSERPYFLRVDSDRELCAQCHRETFEHGEQIHGPVQAGACGACHDPHQSPHRFRLRGAGGDLCAECHQDDLRRITATANVHEPARVDCSHCHEPHVGHDSLRLVESPPQLCFDCHESIQRLVAERPVVHQPVERGRCLDCHDQHGSEFRRLLRGNFTGRLYESFDLRQYELCYGCHDPRQVTEERTTSATSFRNGDVNLHFVHVHRAEKGRTCNVCHEVHAGERPRLANDGAPFGIWDVPTDWQKTESGGSCSTGCHVARGYDRDVPVQNE